MGISEGLLGSGLAVLAEAPAGFLDLFVVAPVGAAGGATAEPGCTVFGLGEVAPEDLNDINPLSRSPRSKSRPKPSRLTRENGIP